MSPAVGSSSQVHPIWQDLERMEQGGEERTDGQIARLRDIKKELLVLEREKGAWELQRTQSPPLVSQRSQGQSGFTRSLLMAQQQLRGVFGPTLTTYSSESTPELHGTSAGCSAAYVTNGGRLWLNTHRGPGFCLFCLGTPRVQPFIVELLFLNEGCRRFQCWTYDSSRSL